MPTVRRRRWGKSWSMGFDFILQEIEGPSTNPYPYHNATDQTENFSSSILMNDKIEERFYCDFENCDFRTKSTSHLKLHKKSVHEGIKHQCDLCDRSYNFPGEVSKLTSLSPSPVLNPEESITMAVTKISCVTRLALN